MYRSNTITILLALALLIAFTGCVKRDFDEPDNGGCVDEELVANITIAALKELYNYTPLQITEDFIIEGVVISNDEDGNFYKELVIQDATAGILIMVDQTNLHTLFPQGRKVYLRLKDMYLSDYNGLLQLGATYNEEDGLQRIPQSLVTDYILRGPCNQTVEPVKVSETELDPFTHQSMVISIELAQFDAGDQGETFAEAGGNSSNNIGLSNCLGSTFIMRTSDFASFAGEVIPTGKFNITGVFSVFGEDQQMKIRSMKDIELLGDTTCPCINIQDPVSGTTTWLLDDIQIINDNQEVLASTDMEDQSYPDPITLQDWTNEAQYGGIKWQAGDGDGNVFARASAFRTNVNRVTAWLITPEISVNGDGEMLSFRSKGEYANGAALLEVLISTNYNGNGNPESYNWEKICPELPIPDSFDDGPWLDASYDLTSYAGQDIHIAFRYRGGDN